MSVFLWSPLTPVTFISLSDARPCKLRRLHRSLCAASGAGPRGRLFVPWWQITSLKVLKGLQCLQGSKHL